MVNRLSKASESGFTPPQRLLMKLIHLLFAKAYRPFTSVPVLPDTRSRSMVTLSTLSSATTRHPPTRHTYGTSTCSSIQPPCLPPRHNTLNKQQTTSTLRLHLRPKTNSNINHITDDPVRKLDNARKTQPQKCCPRSLLPTDSFPSSLRLDSHRRDWRRTRRCFGLLTVI
jgi:hypothetical protein